MVEIGHPAFSLASGSEVGGLISLGEKQGWRARVLGRAPLPTVPVFIGGWWLVPIEQETAPIPSRACERVQAIFRAGIRPKGFVVAHEAPPLLPAPEESVREQQEREQHETRRSWLPAAGAAAVAIGAVAVIPAIAVAVVGLTLALSPLLLLGGLIMVDPCLMAVTEDGYWVEIDRWTS